MRVVLVFLGCVACVADSDDELGSPEAQSTDGETPSTGGPPPWTPADTGTEGPPPADPWFEATVNGGTWSTAEGRWWVDSAQDLMLTAELADGGDLDFFVIGTVDGPGTYAVSSVQYYRFDDPFSAIGAWSSDEDAGSMSLTLVQIAHERLEARWSGSVVVDGIESSGAGATWTVGSGSVVDWPGSGLEDAATSGQSSTSTPSGSTP